MDTAGETSGTLGADLGRRGGASPGLICALWFLGRPDLWGCGPADHKDQN